jgi:hypothetical protein
MMLRGASLRVLRCFAAALMASLVLAQTLGFMHRSVHSPAVHMGHTQEAQHTDHAHCSDAAKTSDSGSGWVGSLFAHQDGDSTCRLVDAQSSFDGAFFAKTSPVIAQPAIHSVAFSQITSTARAAALFEARGPPASL